ncbi:hypothetical protein PanWU01x14_159250 [Parasponia andersonii]|uniref:Uncharacterized protein n=1 Tax=Parasponia andersonii TaxID=3476 RepID=A0A2P5CEJ3_PARAD|nr:hypothetical protein PanWU01x14_159250 [Parasponia andersonii]
MGPLAIRVEWVPFSTISPLSITAISSQLFMVHNRCATTMLVLPVITRSRAIRTSFSD